MYTEVGLCFSELCNVFITWFGCIKKSKKTFPSPVDVKILNLATSPSKLG